MPKYSRNEQIEIANTIIRQMGGWPKLKAFVGAYDILAIDAGVQFRFKGSNTANKIEIKLNHMDIYDIKIYKINMRNIDKSIIPIKEIKDVYNDMLVDIFESSTGLDIHFGD